MADTQQSTNPVFSFSIFWCCSKWQLSIRIFSQIWQFSKDESRKILSTLSSCRQLWEVLAKKKLIFFWQNKCQKTENLWQNIPFFQNIGKNSPPKKSLAPSTGWQLWPSCGWTSAELKSGFTLVTCSLKK